MGGCVTRVKEFLKNEIVLLVSFLLAVISAFFVVPNRDYVDYIDFRTLGLLICLMTVMAGMNEQGVFKYIAEKMLSRVKSVNSLALLLCMLCFFSSMVITNDVALITFVPFTVMSLKLSDKLDKLIWITTLETVSANLGSMLTPIGNPQNLYLFSSFNMTIGSFVKTIFPYALLSLTLIIILCLLTGNDEIKVSLAKENTEFSKLHICLYVVLMFLSILTVFRVIPYEITLLITVIIIAVFNRKVFLKIDYSLLLTFVFLFIFIGNLGNIEAVNSFLSEIVNGNEVLVGIASSQVFSNVPAAILLSKFTQNAMELLVGVNLGGLGTLIASMASLISFKIVAKENVNKSKYMLVFSVVNIVFLVLNIALWLVINRIF